MTDTWQSVAQDNLSAAKQLQEREHVRSCLSRSYYAVYSVLTGYFTQQRMTHLFGDNRNNPSHIGLRSKLATWLQECGVKRQLAYQARRDVRTLYRLRIAADYEVDSELTLDDVAVSLRCASQVMRLTGDNP